MSVQVAFCLFHRFFHRIPAAEDNLDVLIGVHLDAFHHLTDDSFFQRGASAQKIEHENSASI